MLQPAGDEVMPCPVLHLDGSNSLLVIRRLQLSMLGSTRWQYLAQLGKGVWRRSLSAKQQAHAVHAAASALGTRPLPPASALVEGSHRLRTAFLAAVFRVRRGLVPDAASLAELREGALSVCTEPLLLCIC